MFAYIQLFVGESVRRVGASTIAVVFDLVESVRETSNDKKLFRSVATGHINKILLLKPNPLI